MTTIETKTRRLAGTEVFPIGLGAMPMALSGSPSEEQSIRTIHAALDAGVNLIDTADAYAIDESEVGHNERLIAKALQGRYDDVIVATKAGQSGPAARGDRRAPGAHPRGLRGVAEGARHRPHRPLPVPPPRPQRAPTPRPSARSRSSRTRARCAGSGLSNCNVEQLEEALGVAEIVSVQNQLSLGYTGPLAKGEVDACTERGIAFLPWSPLGGIGKAGRHRRRRPGGEGRR